MGVLAGCKPRKEVLKGDLDDAIFAADFGDLVAGKAPDVYAKAKVFFQNTHPAKPLCKIVQVVFDRLANRKEPGITLRLSTGFGGGKSHTLMALWHLAENIADPALGTELLPAAGRPKTVTVAALDASKAGVPVFARHGRVEVKSLWGEIAFRLGGEKTLKSLGPADDSERQPDEASLASLFPAGPVLILIDELVVYMATLSERGQGNLLAFLNKLSSVIGRRPQSALIVTDPSQQRAYATQAAQLAQAVSAAAKLDDIFGRKVSDFDPIGDEAARVIVRRLFESVDPSAAQAASATYHALYERVTREAPGTVPAFVATQDYARRIVDSYPFHPRLLDSAQDRLGALQEFHKSRGTLRLFARILRSVWELREDLELITAGDIDWSSPRIQADLLQRLNRDNFKAATSADVEKHAGELDGGKGRDVHTRVASALLLESIPMQANSGLDPAELTLAVLRPDEAGQEPTEALDRLVGVCWHTYPMPGGRGWQFRYEPNVIKQIEERMTDVALEDARGRVLAEAQGYFSGPAFKLAPWPSSARQVPESAELQLALCEDERIAKAVCAYADDTDPAAPLPRRFRNAIVAVTATAEALNRAVDRAQRLMAAELIEKEHRSGDSSKLVRDQLQRLKPELQRQFRFQTCRAFDRVVLASGAAYSIDEQFQVPEEQLLQRPQGQACLKRFLEEKKLVYQPGDAVDVARFIKNVLPGATPLPDKPGVYTARAVHERFLAAPNLRLVPDAGVVRQSILKAVGEGKAVARLADGRAYDSKGSVEGPDGARRRGTGMLTTLPLDDVTYVAVADSEPARLWVREDERGRGTGPVVPPPPPSPTRVTATTWDKVVEFAGERPLVHLGLMATTPSAAAALVALAQPLGAETIALSVSASGTLKDGGTMNFATADVRPAHPTRPLAIAQTIYNALAPGGTYEAELALGFGGGRSGLEEQLKALADAAPEGVSPHATFDKPPSAAVE